MSGDKSLQVPVIDISKLLDDNDDELAKLHWASKEWGIFQLINHGLSEELLQKLKTDAKDFFEQSLDAKRAYSQLPNSVEGFAQASVGVEGMSLLWRELLFLIPLPTLTRKMRFWPTVPSSFRATIDKFSVELQRVSMQLLMKMGKNLGVDEEKFGSMFANAGIGMRMNYYPPSEQSDEIIGLSPHTDGTGISLLIQDDDEVHGLQVKKDGKWVPIKPIANAVIIGVGDIIEVMSNGEYKSVEHRAVVDPKKGRISIVTFHSSNSWSNIGPLPDVVKEKAAKYKTINHEEYLRMVVKKKGDDGKNGLLSHMRIY